MSQLLIRCGFTDNLVIEDLLTPSPAPQLRPTKPLVAQVVMDAALVGQRPRVAEAARDAGVPFVVDPCTPLLQSEVDPTNRWATLPFGTAASVQPLEIDIDALVANVVEFQLENGATRIIAPYLYAANAQDPAFAVSVRLLEGTARYLDENRLRVPLMAVLCGQLQGFDVPAEPGGGLAVFLRTAAALDARAVGLCLSPLGSTADKYRKMVRLFRTASKAVALSQVPLLAWRQGVYGPALTAVGFAGYETGIGTGEQTNIAGFQQNRKPKDPDAKRSGGGGAGVYLEPLGRSVPPKVAAVLMGTPAMRAKVMCEDESCCATVSVTIDNPRPHAIRGRARLLAELDAQPHARWRLNHLAQQAAAAATLARQGDRLLSEDKVAQRLGTPHYEAYSRVLSEMVEATARTQSA